MRTATREVESFDALGASEMLFGNTTAANFLLVGAAFQSGGLRIPASAIEEAIEINGVAVASNLAAFKWGRAAIAAPTEFAAAVRPVDERPEPQVPVELFVDSSTGICGSGRSSTGRTAAANSVGAAIAARPHLNAARFEATATPLISIASSIAEAGKGSPPGWNAAPTSSKFAAVVLPNSVSEARSASNEDPRWRCANRRAGPPRRVGNGLVVDHVGGRGAGWSTRRPGCVAREPSARFLFRSR